MLYFLFGPDTYRSRRKLNEIIAAYREKAGSELNFHRFDAEENDCAGLKAITEGGSLFYGKKLAVVEYPFNKPRDWEILYSLFEHAASQKDAVVVAWDRELDAKGKKRLEEIKPRAEKIEEFDFLSGERLKKWIEAEARRRQMVLRPEDRQFSLALGGDLWAISHFFEKIALSAESHAVSRPPRSPNVFQLSDVFFADESRALGELLSLLDAGEDEARLFSYLAGQARNILLAGSYQSRGQEVSPAHGLHPFVVKKAGVIARMRPVGVWEEQLLEFFRADVNNKTGSRTPGESLIEILIRGSVSATERGRVQSGAQAAT
jgi:DNA polymerase III delta subunit